MGIEIPKYVIQEKGMTQPRSKLVIIISVLIALVVGFVFNELYSNRKLATLRTQNEVLEENNRAYLNKVSELESKKSLLETELKIKQQAVVALQSDYKLRLDELNQLKQDIQFYERLLSPNLKNKGLRVFEATIVERSQAQKNISIIFVNKIARANEVYGKYSLHVTGTQNGRQQSINLLEGETNKYRFKYFHKVSFDFSLPDSFKPEQLVVKLFPKIKKAKTIEYKAPWHSLIK